MRTRELEEYGGESQAELAMREYFAHRRTEGVVGMSQLLGSFYDQEFFFFVQVRFCVRS